MLQRTFLSRAALLLRHDLAPTVQRAVVTAAQQRASVSSVAATSADAPTTVGFVGLGNMGGHMVANLVGAGHKVVAYDVSAPALEAAAANGAKPVSSPADIGNQASVVITMLPSSPHVRTVVCGPEGILEGVEARSDANDGVLLIDSSTIDPNVSREVAAECRERANVRMVDAPVSGGVGGAEAGTLTFMVGAESDNDFTDAKNVLQHMGSNIVHCGGVGTGEVAKLCNNLVLGISMIGVSEAMNLGQKLGIDATVLAGIMNSSTARCWSSDTYNPCPGVMEGVPASRGYTGGFGAALMLKDLGLAGDAAHSVGAPVPLGASAAQFYRLMCAHGEGMKDFSAAFEFLDGDKN